MVALVTVLAVTGILTERAADTRGKYSQFAPGACVTLRQVARANGHRVFIDPGHGGIDPGAVGRTTSEPDVVEKQLTRELRARIACANEADAQLFADIHFDAVNAPNVGGAETISSPERRSRAVAADQPMPPAPSSIDPLQGPPPRALLGRIPTVLPTRRRLIPFTFDAGGDDGGLPKIVRTLMRLPVPATFFLAGHFASSFPNWARAIAAAYPIANHTLNRLDLNTLSDARVRAEIVDAAKTIRRVRGRPPQPPQAFATAFPRWAASSRRVQSQQGSLPPTQAVERFVRLGLPVYCGGSRHRLVALTFDDGPGPATSTTLELLRHDGASATFFLVGRNLARWPQLPRDEALVGAVGDHTWTHPFLTHVPVATMQREIASTQAALQRATGQRILLFRPPYGFHDADVDREVRRLGMLQVLWSLDSRDSYPPPGATATEILRTLSRSLHPGSIVLLHENLRETKLALPGLLRELQSKRLTPVSVPELLALDPPNLAQIRNGIHGCIGANA